MSSNQGQKAAIYLPTVSFCSRGWGGGGCIPACTWMCGIEGVSAWGGSLLGGCLPGSRCYSRFPRDGCCRGRYASYWNAYLFNFCKQFDLITDGITNRYSSYYMSLCASCTAAPLVAVRLNYKFVTKSYVFADQFNQSNFDFCDNTNSFIYFRYIILMPYIS